MLYLKQAADESPPLAVPLAERTALRLERALLIGDRAARRAELAAAAAEDRELGGWMLRTAELRASRTVNRVEDAAEWLCGCLEAELAASVVSEPADSSASEIEWRLLALVAKLSSYKRALHDFEAKLEREKLDALKELAYGASHEINNPLANIAARAQTLLEDEPDPERQRKLTAIHRQAMRAHEMISDLMLFARPPKLNLARCDLGRMVDHVICQLSCLAGEYGVELTRETGEEPIELLADETQLGVAVHALILNALEASAAGGHVRVAVVRTTLDEQPAAEVAVRDDGPGISEEVRRHIFEPFFSGREAGRGLGFGLSKCWRIVTDHGGQVIAQRPSGGGAEVAMFLPLSPTARC